MTSPYRVACIWSLAIQPNGRSRFVLADSFGRIFYRNVINLGVPLIVCPGISKIVKRGDVLTVDMTTGKVMNETTGTSAEAQPLSEYVLNILESGGIKPMIKKEYGQE